MTLLPFLVCNRFSHWPVILQIYKTLLSLISGPCLANQDELLAHKAGEAMLVFLTFLNYKDEDEKIHCIDGYREQVETALELWKQSYEVNTETNVQVRVYFEPSILALIFFSNF